MATNLNEIQKFLEAPKGPNPRTLFDPATDLLLSAIAPTGTVKPFFDEYFSIPGKAAEHIPKPTCGNSSGAEKLDVAWPMVGRTCVNLDGHRGHSYPPPPTPPTPPPPVQRPNIKRIFVGDLVWLFYFERMGIFKILGVILDDYATRGKYPLARNHAEVGIVLEGMIREMKAGVSSAVRDRDSSYRRALGWTSDVGNKLGSTSVVNAAFNNLFNELVQSALTYYRDRRLANAINAVNTGAPSVATRVQIAETIRKLKTAFDAFTYGRNYTNTLNGIVWAIAGLGVIDTLRPDLGIPTAYDTPSEFVTAAYDLLVAGGAAASGEINRFDAHERCAVNGRNLLLDVQGLIGFDPNVDETLVEAWLNAVEGSFETYRTAYRSLTGIDLGAAGSTRSEQQA